MTLPLSVAHLDLDKQKHTNALVLEHLLRPENTVMPAPEKTAKLLSVVAEMDPPVQVLLDVGAQILEFTNLEVAREWLKRRRTHEQVQAVVFFDEDDELVVLDQRGRIEPLQTSPFASQLDVCLVFLDEAHTRGTDLRLPEHYKAAVTLGPHLTKDRLIQACMRMRKLGHGQSVVFCVPEEIRNQIVAQKQRGEGVCIDVSDILSWAVAETWIDIRRSMPLWAVQGRRFEHHRRLWDDARVDGVLSVSKSHAENFLENESQSLAHRYRPQGVTHAPSSVEIVQNVNLQRIASRCLEFDSLDANVATLQEEQERELSPEIVRQREVQRPAPAEPAAHSIHPDLIKFVSKGKIVTGSQAFQPAFEALRLTSAAAHMDVSQFPSDVLVTVDSARTVQLSGRSALLDAYQRPVQWILTSTGHGDIGADVVKHLVIVSPYEAYVLEPLVRRSKRTMLHQYAPRPNLGVRSLDGLDLYTISGMLALPRLPLRLIVQLNLFAGQLYLSSFREYVELCTTLGLAWQTIEGEAVIAADGFIIRSDDPGKASICGFRESPIPFLRAHMTKIRRNCEEIDRTHMGALLDGHILRPSDFGESTELGSEH
ncbi:hypothetical protein LTR06_011264 [Exophiala xenobiotica]|nr:hypothetical protein LTR06_011264 [Exophiala xenobiotica]